jgi:hypothetical protein
MSSAGGTAVRTARRGLEVQETRRKESARARAAFLIGILSPILPLSSRIQCNPIAGRNQETGGQAEEGKIFNGAVRSFDIPTAADYTRPRDIKEISARGGSRPEGGKA